MASKFIKIERDFTVTKSLKDDGTFEGYASVFSTEDNHGDTVRKGAFGKGLQKLAKSGKKIKMLFNHDRYQPIGVFTRADEDDTGLYVEGKLTLGVQKADETRLLMLDEAIDSMSIGGYVVKEHWDNKYTKRELSEIELREISPVVFPALDQARILSVKSLTDDASMADVELILRDAGFSRSESKRLISIIKGATPHRDVERIAGSIDNLQNILNNLKG